MAEARVESIEALKWFKAALWKFAEGVNVAMADAESEVNRTMIWLETEQTSYWKGQHKKREEMVVRCKDAVRQKKLFRDSAGREPAAIEEEKALKMAKRKLIEAEDKALAVNKAIKQLQREIPIYQGSVQRLTNYVQIDVPMAAAHLENLLSSLESYVSYGAPVEVSSSATRDLGAAVGSDQAASMARAIDDEEDKADAPADDQPSKETKE